MAANGREGAGGGWSRLDDGEERKTTRGVLREYSLMLERWTYKREPKDGADIRTCVANLVLSTVGVSVLAIPWSTMEVGWLQAVVCLSLCYLLSVYNLYLLDVACRESRPGVDLSSYAQVVGSILGKPGAYVLEVLMLLYSLGMLVSYIGTIGRELSAILARFNDVAGLSDAELASPHRQSVLTVVVAVFAVMPLSLLGRSITRHLGSLGAVCLFIVTSVILLLAPWKASFPFLDACGGGGGAPGPVGDSAKVVAWVPSMSAFFRSAPIFVFAMNGATAFVNIRSQLVTSKQAAGTTLVIHPAPSTTHKFIWVAQSIAFLAYAVCSLAGYFTFCGDTTDNVLDHFPTVNRPSLLDRSAIIVQLTCSSAAVFTPLARAALWQILCGLGSEAPGHCTSLVLTMPILGVATALAVTLGGGLAIPLGLTSAVCTTGIMFVFPGLCAYVSRPANSPLLTYTILPLTFAAGGLVNGLLSAVTIVMDAV